MSTPENAARSEVHRLPAPAPTPPENPGKAATDSQGVRHYDAEDIKSHGLDPAAAKKRSKTFSRSASSSRAPVDTPVNDFRRVAATLPPRVIRHPSPNYYIPSFGLMFSILATMNDKVCTLRPFGETGTVNDWIPQVSVIVFSVLGYIQVLRAQQLCGLTDSRSSRLLSEFVSHFPLETITIPGPLVPFFRSLSVANPGFGNYQDVFPAIPPFVQTEDQLYNMNFTCPPPYEYVHEGLTMMLPNIPLMMDQFVHLISYLLAHSAQNPRLYSSYQQLRKIFGVSQPAANQPANPPLARLLRSVGFWERPTASNGLMFRFASYIAQASAYFPLIPTYNANHAPADAQPNAEPPVAARAANWDTINGLFESMMMFQQHNWFSTFLSGMHTFNKHWKGNVPMIDIHPTSSSASLILFQEAEVTAIAAPTLFTTSRLNFASHRLVYNTKAVTACPYIVNEDFEDAQVAQVNLHSRHAFAHGLTIGHYGQTRYGEYFANDAYVVETDQGNLTGELQSMTRSLAFFSET